MIRRTVPNDNSCLFYALAYLCEDGVEASRSVEQRLRSLCAKAALEDTTVDPLTKALFLGQPSVEAYGDWIRNAHHWGGENEIITLAQHYGVEVVVVSAESLSVLCYNQEAAGGSKGRIYILYTGQHYDPLVGAGSDATTTTSTKDEIRLFPLSQEKQQEEREASALEIARQHNREAARKAKQKRVERIKCGGCGALLEDATAFQTHCMEVDHDDDFAYDCEKVEVVLEEGEALPDNSIDLTDETKYHVYYNADDKNPLSSAAPYGFTLEGTHYKTMEHYWQSMRCSDSGPSSELAAQIAAAPTVQYAMALSNHAPEREDWDRIKEQILLQGLKAKFGLLGEANAVATAALQATAPKTIVCVDVDPWGGMSASGGIATGRNHVGKALEVVRSQLMDEGMSNMLETSELVV